MIVRNLAITTADILQVFIQPVNTLVCRRLPFSGKIRLLDVGSCYNPFQAFAEFSAVGIDICPAVHVCFCSVQI